MRWKFFFFRATMHFFLVGGKQNWNVIDESEGYQSLLLAQKDSKWEK